MSMFVLTLIQPYASLIATQAKTYEFSLKRPGREKWGKVIGIHAARALSKPSDVKTTIEIMNDHGPGVVGIKDEEKARQILNRFLDDPESFPQSEIIATAKMRIPVRVRDIVKNGNPHGFHMDMWALPFVKVKRLKNPVPMKGKSTMWVYDGDLTRRKTIS